MRKTFTLFFTALSVFTFTCQAGKVCLPRAAAEAATGTVELPAPEVTDFFIPADGARGDLYFNFPATDRDGNSLDKEKLFFNIIIDGDVHELYSDEYPEEVSKEAEPMTDIPYNMSGTEIWNAGNMHCFHYFVYGFDSFALRTKYVDGENVSYSPVVYAYGKPSSTIPAGPDGLEIVTEAPEGASEQGCLKEGGYFYYSGGSDVEYADMDGNVCRYFISGDKMYLEKSLTKVPITGLLVGTIGDDSTVTFEFPQYLHHLEAQDAYGLPTVVDIYALACEFVKSEDNPESGSFYPSTTSQTVRFRLNGDGSLTALDEDILIGSCMWVTTRINEDTGREEPIDEPYWSWDGNGDILTGLTPITEVAQSVPEDVVMDGNWVLVDGSTGVPVRIGTKEDRMYLTGMYPAAYCETGPMIGTIDGDKVRFPSGQFLAADYRNGILICYKAGRAEGRDIYALDELVFDYDAAKGTLSCPDIAVFTSNSTQIIHYVDAPRIIRSDVSQVGLELYDPVIYSIRMAEGVFPGELEFVFPNVDRSGNLLDTSRLTYKVFVDDEEFVLYADEYPDDMPEGADSMTEIPYDWNGSYLYRLGNSHFFDFFFQDFEKLAIQTQYVREDGETSRSAMVYVPGFGDSGIAQVPVEGVTEYYDLQGMPVEKPARGNMYLRVTHLPDGSIRTSKTIFRE